jgi:hypothetical protein
MKRTKRIYYQSVLLTELFLKKSVQMKDTIITARKVFWKLISGRELRGLLWQMVDFFNTFMLSEEAISHLETVSIFVFYLF